MVRDLIAAINSFVQEHINGMSVVQDFFLDGRNEEWNGFKSINQHHTDALQDRFLFCHVILACWLKCFSPV